MAKAFTTKVVGRRNPDGPGDGTLQRTMARLRGTDALVPRGLYRFRSFEEADQWMVTMMARTHANRRLKTSPASAQP